MRVYDCDNSISVVFIKYSLIHYYYYKYIVYILSVIT